MKKTLYIILTIILLMVIAFFIYQFSILFFTSKISYLIAIAVISIIGGYGLGETWWQFVYVQRRHRKFIKEDATKK